jgi:predicted TIM-barrel fold metal-dependent hydrolase
MMSNFLDLPIIDAHVHLWSMDGIPEHAKLMDESGFHAINIVCTATRNHTRANQNLMGMLCKALHPERVYLFGGLNYTVPGGPTKENLRSQAEQLLDTGCDGMKMIEGKPPARKRTGLALDSPVYDDYYALLQSRGTPIVYHVADPETWWDPKQAPEMARQRAPYWEDDEIPSKEQLHGEVDGMLEKFPNLRVIFAHFYFMSNFPDRASEFMDAHPQISFDLAPGSEMYRNFSKRPQRWREFFTKYQDRIIFATDNITAREPREERYKKLVDKIWMIRNFLETDEEFEGFGSVVKGLCLHQEVLEKIYCKNFQRYAGDRPRQLNIPAAIDQSRSAIEQLSSGSEDSDARSTLREILQQLETVEGKHEK